MESDPGPTETQLARTRQALTSPVACKTFQILAGGTGSPSALAQALGKSKHAISLQLAQLREAGLIEEAPHPSGDARRKRYVPAWHRFGAIFAHDHALELSLFHDHLLTEDRPPRTEGEPRRLVVSGTGRLVAVGKAPIEAPEETALAGAHEAVQATIWGFQRFLEVYLSARSYPTLREYLRGAYQELVRYADRLPEDPALARFARFQARAFGHAEGVDTLLGRALAGARPSQTALPDRSPADLRWFQPVGHQTTDGTYVLQEGAQAIIQQGLPMEVRASYVHRADPR